MGEPTKWEKVKIAIEGFKVLKTIWTIIKFVIALFAVYGGSMAYQMQPEIAAIKQNVETAMAKLNEPVKPVAEKPRKPRLTVKDIQPIVDQAIEKYQREHKIR